MSEFISTSEFNPSYFCYPNTFKPLDDIGYPNCVIDLEGICINLKTNSVPFYSIEYDRYYLRNPFEINAPTLSYPTHYLVKIAWWKENLDTIIHSPYWLWIKDYKEFMSLPDEDKVLLPYSTSENKNILTRYGELWRTKFMIKTYGLKGSSGYRHVDLDKNHRNVDMHRLVAKHFVKIPDEFIQQGYHEGNLIVNHIDGNKENNRWDNLEWLTRYGNIQHASRNNLMRVTVTDVELRKIWILLSKGYKDIEISKLINVNKETINNIRHQHSDRYKTDEFDWPGKNDISDEVRERYMTYIDEYNKGLSLREIAVKYNSSESSVRRAFRKYPDLVCRKAENEYQAKKERRLMSMEELKQIFEYLKQGLTNGEIARITDRPITVIRNIRNKETYTEESKDQVWPMSEDKIPNNANPKVIKQILDMYSKGMDGREIAKEFNLSPSTIYRIIRDNK